MDPLIVQIVIVAIQSGVPLVMALGRALYSLISRVIDHYIRNQVVGHLERVGAGSDDVHFILAAVVSKMGGESATRPLADALGIPYAEFEAHIRANIERQLAELKGQSKW